MMVRIAGLILLVASVLVVPLTHAQTMPQTGPQPGGPQDTTIKDPRSRAKLHTELGTLYFQDRNVPVAMEELTIAIYIDPTYAPAYGMRALVHNYLREPQHAEDNFREALRYAPDDPEIANNYGWFLCQNGKYKEAHQCYDSVLNFGPAGKSLAQSPVPDAGTCLRQCRAMCDGHG